MHLYFTVWGHLIPSYGLMIVLGVLTANLLAVWLCYHYQLDGNNLIILEAYAFLGGFIGAKLLYLIVSAGQIEWSRLIEPDYFNQLMQGGFVFYGGLIGGILFVLLAGKLHHIRIQPYLTHCIALIPVIHGFGRVGCFLAGCCYGRPYDGILAVTFPKGGIAPSDTGLFPVQLVEAAILMVLAAGILFCDYKLHLSYTVELYLAGYALVRFVLEYFRFDAARGKAGLFSTSQWISIVIFAGTVLFGFYRIRTSKRKRRS